MDFQCDQSASVNSDDSTATAIDLNRLANQIAIGLVPFPNDLEAEDSNRIAAAVRERRRSQLVKFLARQVAIHIARATSGRR